jgi:hypothetical protein
MSLLRGVGPSRRSFTPVGESFAHGPVTSDLDRRDDVEFEELGFEPSYRCRIVADPRDRSDDEPDTGARRITDLTVEVEPRDGPPWRRVFPGFLAEYPLSGAFACPSPVHVCIVATGRAFMVSVLDPDDVEVVPGWPIAGLRRVPRHPILLLWGDSDLVAYGEAGRLWWIEGLSIEELEISDVRPDGIHGTAWRTSSGPDPYVPSGRVPFVIEPYSGTITGGCGSPFLHLG